jgi:Fe-S cluster assembly protein SufD
LSDRDALLDEGVEVAALADLLTGEGAQAADLLTVPELAGDDIAVALNTAFAGDGLVVSVKDGARPSKPIEIVNVISRGAPLAVYARNRIVVGEGAEATFLESVLGGAENSEINIYNEYRVGAGVRLTVARLQATDEGANQIATNIVRLGARAELKHLSVEAGGGFSRNQTFASFLGEHSRADILGVSMLSGRRHIDQTLVVDHAVPHCDGMELFKTVLDDRSHGVFQGQIMVRPGAQKVNSKMMSQALLLSEEAEMDAKPELEIFADDVVCGHGATSGQIDRTMLFYLMARGIPRAQAERLLVDAFLAEAIDALGDAAIADALKTTVSAWLAARDRRETRS